VLTGARGGSEAARVTVVIVHLDSRPELMDCLRSLSAVEAGELHVVLVENGSPRPLELASLRAAEPRVSDIVRSPVNRGFAGGANLGIRLALGRAATHVLLLNDDALVTPGFLRPLLDVALGEPDAAAVGPTVLLADPPDTLWFAGARFDRTRGDMRSPGAGGPPPPGGEIRDSDYVTGCCALLTRRALERVGLLDERFFLYFEDADWGLRARAEGLRNLVVTASRVRHRVAVSSGGLESPLHLYHGVRSRLQFVEIHAPGDRGRLVRRLWRDVAALLLRSRSPRRWALVRAHLAGVRDWRRGLRGPGPPWIWRGRV
jgi:GT2 family glycosyltransferase